MRKAPAPFENDSRNYGRFIISKQKLACSLHVPHSKKKELAGYVSARECAVFGKNEAPALPLRAGFAMGLSPRRSRFRGDDGHLQGFAQEAEP